MVARKICFFFLSVFTGFSYSLSALAQSASITDGQARFTVLTPTLIRMEYSGDSLFEDRPSFNIINRNLPTPPFTTRIDNGWREITTDKLVLRYRQNSGSFADSNLTVRLTVSGSQVTLHPWRGINSIFEFDQICEAEQATLFGGASFASDHQNYSGSGFVAGLWQLGAGIIWNMNNDLSADTYTVAIRYSDGLAGDGFHKPRTISLYIDSVRTQILLDTTADWDNWKIYRMDSFFTKGSHVIKIACEQGESYNVNIDWLAVIPVGGNLPGSGTVYGKTNLGGWFRGLDGQSGPIPLTDGLLSQDGWYLIDDSSTPVDSADWVVPRVKNSNGYQDGYFFGYGHDYTGALCDFYMITGNPPLLPKWAFGIWFSRYYAYHDQDYTDSLLPAFRKEKVPLDVLVIDTDWKYPSGWDGWNWNNDYFPNPWSFLDWTKGEGLHVTLNIHPSIQGSDPQFQAANSTAGGLVKDPSADQYYFDFSNRQHIKAYFDLHKQFNDQGIRFWWLDWCCEGIKVSVEGLPGDTWINSLYAGNATERGLRGFAFARIGNGYVSYSGSSAPGTSWSEHRYTIHFTGDTYATWDMLSFESYFTIREGNIGLPYVTHDIGSFNQFRLDNDMYIRWLQLATFQPVFRLHSNHGLRLPWYYPEVKNEAESLMRLRHSLIPYIYSMAYKSSEGGLPLVRGMYLYYPEQTEAYYYDRQYMFGDNFLVSPIASPGKQASTTVWFPNGTWTNFFTDEIINGPITKTISCDLSSMPAFVKSGSIIPMIPYSDYTGQAVGDTLLMRVYTGDDAFFDLYDDEGDDLAYKTGQYAITRIEYSESGKILFIHPSTGDYNGMPEKRPYRITFFNFGTTPSKIAVNDTVIERISSPGAEAWWTEGNKVVLNLNKRLVKADSIRIAISFLSQVQSSPAALKIYPNPSAGGPITIEYSDINSNPAGMEIVRFDGIKIYSGVIFNNSRVVIDSRKFSKGLYLVRVRNGRTILTAKVVID
ncbi:MAG: TIM-barrel domain-containing protein [Bacteroidales bacterium]|jgi:alpha-glucosidase (family GH31 glycosyl hydrolase)